MKMEENVLLSIRCITYNHEPYIRQCLEGFVMQKTNFKFVAIVHDDASTDGTAAVIREYAEKYPDIIKPIYETENQYSKHDGSLRRIMNNACRGKYVAYCEGDDYWTDPYKLQMQVDFLEANPDYSCCYTDLEAFNNETGEVQNITKAFKSGSCYEDFITYDYRRVSAYTLTICASRRFIDTCPYPNDPDVFTGDRFMLLHLLSQGKIKYLSAKTARYRILRESASHFTDWRKGQRSSYTWANAHFWWLKHGPKISGNSYRTVLHEYGSKRISYALMTNNVRILKETKYSFGGINCVKDVVCLLIKVFCSNRPMFHLASIFYTKYREKYH